MSCNNMFLFARRFYFIFTLFVSPSPSLDVAQFRGHYYAGSSPTPLHYQLRYALLFLSREAFSAFFPLVDSRRNVPTHHAITRSRQLLVFLENKISIQSAEIGTPDLQQPYFHSGVFINVPSCFPLFFRLIVPFFYFLFFLVHLFSFLVLLQINYLVCSLFFFLPACSLRLALHGLLLYLPYLSRTS